MGPRQRQRVEDQVGSPSPTESDAARVSQSAVALERREEDRTVRLYPVIAMRCSKGPGDRGVILRPDEDLGQSMLGNGVIARGRIEGAEMQDQVAEQKWG